MTLFELVKQTILVRDAAEHYGLQVNRSGMCRCPFHDDRHPSMKLNEKYFYCFGCGATGDVIDLVARLFGLSSFEAAQKLAQDFGIDPDKPPAAIALPKPERPLLKAYRQEEVRCLRLEDIAHAAHISRSEAGRCFNTYLGCSPVDALIQYRLQTARSLLKERALTLQEVSAACGFHSANYFSRKFRQAYGYPPSLCEKMGK